MKTQEEKKVGCSPSKILKAIWSTGGKNNKVDWSKYSNTEKASISMFGVAAAAPLSTYLGYPFNTLNTFANRKQWPNNTLLEIAKKEGLLDVASRKTTSARHFLSPALRRYEAVIPLLMRGAKTVGLNGPANKIAFMGPPVVIDALTEGGKLEKYAFPLGLLASAGFQGAINYHARKAHLYESAGVAVKDPTRFFWLVKFSPRCLFVHMAYFIWSSAFTLGGMKVGEAFWRDRAPAYYDILGSLTTLPFVQLLASPVIIFSTILMSPGGKNLSLVEAAKLVNLRALFTTPQGLLTLATMTAWKVVENGSLRVFSLRTKTFFARTYNAIQQEEKNNDEKHKSEVKKFG